MADVARAMVLTEFNKPLEMTEYPIPQLCEGEILVKITSAGVCGSDVHMWQGHDPRTPVPIILGHEALGRIEDIGGNKKDIYGETLQAGDLIGWDRGVTCGSCYFCTVKKQPYLCPNRKVYGISISSKQPPHLKGGYATHMVLDAKTNIIKLAPDTNTDILVSASCAGATAAHAVEQCDIDQGDTVVVIGTGSVGLFSAAFALNRGAAQLVAIDVEDSRLEKAKEFGATHTLHATKTSPEHRQEVIREITHGIGADVVIDASGYAPAILDGIRMCRRGGTYTFPGIAVPVGETSVKFYEDISVKNLVIRGAWVSDTSHFRQAVEIVLSGRYPFDTLSGRTYQLEESNEALGATANREVLKAVIKP